MKTFTPFAAAVLVFMLVQQTQAALAAVTGREKIAAILKDDFRFAPPAIESPSMDLKHEEPVIVMETFTVTESMAQRDLERKLRERARREAETKFSKLKGGLMTSKTIGPLQADIGIWPEIVERSVGPTDVQDFMLKVDLLRLRW